jgi:DNA excision repair protein ERCC-4
VTNSAISADNPDPVIVCDTREQEPLVFTRLRSVRGTLTTGDYGILGAEHAAAIERKIIDDLVAYCGPERERFKRELQRMRGYPFRRLVIVGSRADIEAGRYRSQMKPRAVLASLSAFEVRYDLPIYYFPDPRPPHLLALEKTRR